MTEALHIDADAGDTLPPGTPLLQGQFLVEGFLNAGGFGITYLARDSLDRRIVLKECFPSTMCCRTSHVVRARSRSHQGEFDAVVRLFGQEARRLSRLEHPNIVGVRDVFEENGTAYMALDHVDGRDLLDVIEKETWRLDPETLRELAISLLDAIGHVHARGMLHRDISPDNILLTDDDTPILIDFGAARDTARRKSRMLSALHVVKDGYSPQEFYLQAGEQSPASDLYALAASLHHAITGEPPAYSHSRLAAIAEQAPDPYVPLAGRVEGYDPRFLAMIDRALAVFAKDRVQSAAEWMAGIAGADMAGAVSLDDAEIAERVRRLVEATNPEVAREQERRARERAERARRAEEEREAREAARRRRLAEARREAEEAERTRQDQDGDPSGAAPLMKGAADGARLRVGAPGDGAAQVTVIPPAETARKVTRADLIREKHARLRSRASTEDTDGGETGNERPASRGTIFGRVLGGRRRSTTKTVGKVQGFGT